MIASKAPAPTSAAVTAPLAIANINAVPVHLLILGAAPITLAPAPQLINILVAAPAIPAAPALPVMANIKNAPANQAMNGKTGLVRKKP